MKYSKSISIENLQYTKSMLLALSSLIVPRKYTKKYDSKVQKSMFQKYKKLCFKNTKSMF